jgi:hypothetical protein
MNAFTARALARTWVETLPPLMPGLVAAHLVGGITTTADDEPFPLTKDVDIHLIFEVGSPALRTDGMLMNILEVPFEGLIIEAGIRSIEEYLLVDAVLGNPEIAHHLTLDSLLYDPTGRLTALQVAVRRDYAGRRWVEARIEHERQGLERSFGFREMGRALYGISGELNMLGYGCTFSSAVLDVAMLQAPRVGGKFLVRLGGTLERLGHPELFDDMLRLFGIHDINRTQAEQLLADGAELFDTALAVRSTPHPFQHKLHPHMRAYFVDSCAGMIADGHHREAIGWMLPYICSCSDVIKTDGTPEQQAWASDRQLAFQQLLGIVDERSMDQRFAQAEQVHARFFALAEQIAEENPAIHGELARATS